MKYKIIFSYDGTHFSGYQKQENQRTVQSEIERVLSQINNESVRISASGRTDAGVHAIGQVAHFTTTKNWNPKKLQHALNSLLPEDIYIKTTEVVNENFHARFDVTKKEYIYMINIKEYNPLERNYIYQYGKSLDSKAIEEAIPYFVGTHNYKAFTKVGEEKENYIRTIYEIKLEEKQGILILHFLGNGFLRYMVRNIVGTLIEIGAGKRSYKDINSILESEDRKQAGITAPPCGLYLYKVYYEELEKEKMPHS